MSEPERRFWSAAEVAEFLGLRVGTVRQYAREGRIPAPRVFGRLRKWDRLELAAWSDAGCPPLAEWRWPNA